MSINNNINDKSFLYILNQRIVKKIKKIKVVLTDVDGVLTDGGMFYTKDGDVIKKFHARDGMGISLLRKNKISTIIVTKETTLMVKAWAKKMNVAKLYDGIKQKEEIIERVCSEFKVTSEELAYIGDDVNDIGLLSKVGFSAVPKDAISSNKKIVDYVCKTDGGKGVLREIADLILISQELNANYQ